jgi:Sulfatase
MITSRNRWLGLLSFLVSAMLAGVPASAQQQQKPNILVIMGDDIGYWNISAYNRGMMGYRTPNIDRIANEGARSSPTTTASNPAPPAAPRSSPDSHRCARDC